MTIFSINFLKNLIQTKTHRIRSGSVSLWTSASHRRGWSHATWMEIKVVIPVITSVIIVIKWFSVSPAIIRITIIVIIYNKQDFCQNFVINISKWMKPSK